MHRKKKFYSMEQTTLKDFFLKNARRDLVLGLFISFLRQKFFGMVKIERGALINYFISIY